MQPRYQHTFFTCAFFPNALITETRSTIIAANPSSLNRSLCSVPSVPAPDDGSGTGSGSGSVNRKRGRVRTRHATRRVGNSDHGGFTCSGFYVVILPGSGTGDFFNSLWKYIAARIATGIKYAHQNNEIRLPIIVELELLSLKTLSIGKAMQTRNIP